MQWIIDIVKLKLASYLEGKIFLWSGAIVDIPTGWALCNGMQGTPNLMNHFILGAGNSYNPSDIGGTTSHKHTYDLAGLWHVIPANADLLAGDGYEKKTPTHHFIGPTWLASVLPPYYSLIFIMKL